MDRSNLFRKVAVQRGLSADQLDQVLEATNPRGWVGLAAICLLLIVGIAWSVAGRIPTKVQGRGILLRSGGILEVVSPTGGRVSDITVQIGDSVSEGETVAWLVQPDLMDELETAREELAAAREEHAQLVAFGTRQADLERKALDQQEEEAEAALRSAEERMRLLAQRLEAQQALRSQGLITQVTLLDTRQQHDQASERARQARSTLAEIALRRLELENRTREALRTAQLRVARAEAEVERLERELAAKTQVVSPFTGRILEVLAEQGTIVERGDPIVSLDLTGRSVQQLVGIFYVPSRHGKMVRPGMPIHIAPSTVRQEEYGMMVGTVSFVSDYPATTRAMLRVLKNQALVQDLAGTEAPYEVHATLLPDPTTTSRYRWTSSGGPPLQIESGTLATAFITVRDQRPIELILPAMRGQVGR
ncbi:MAG: NHLP bacteriocin system secretion protein [Gammaproteobacteria bacterium]